VVVAGDLEETDRTEGQQHLESVLEVRKTVHHHTAIGRALTQMAIAQMDDELPQFLMTPLNESSI